ncbi:MAG: histidine kinase [Cyclobacteriaceae bacterium]
MHRVFHFFNINNRVYYHLLFWLCYFLYRVMLYGDIKNTYENVAYVQALELILKVVCVYFILYFLKPRYFNRRRYFFFSLSFVVVSCVASYFQLHVIWLCVNLGIFADIPREAVFTRWKFFSAMGHLNWIIVVAFIIKVVKEGFENAQVNSKLLKEKLEAELQFLKSQVNPHFFFNTLNNLYALTVKKSDKAPDVLLKLSELMSYMIYDTAHKTVKLDKELEFIENYVELEKLRYGEYLEVEITKPEKTFDVEIPPLLFLPFIENAFKHGVAKGGQSNRIIIVFEIKNLDLNFTVRNNIAKSSKIEDSGGGIGLSNIKRRLELLFAGQHDLKISNDGEYFNADLNIRGVFRPLEP